MLTGIRVVIALAFLPAVGTIGLMLIENWSFFDSLYMAVITITTVGYNEVEPLSTAGRIFIMVYLVVGLGVFFFGIVYLGELALRAELNNWFGRRRMHSELQTMRDHFIICGGGRMGLALCQQLAAKKFPFVVIDQEEAVLQNCGESNWFCVVGDATDDRVLQQAGIERAVGLAAVLSTDADNLYVALSARSLVPGLRIVTRAIDESSVPKMQKAGADRVITLFGTSAMKMAQLLANPNLEDFFEVVSSPGTQLDLAEINVEAGSEYEGKTLAATDLRQHGIMIVGIRRADGQLVLPPEGTDKILAGDNLIALGRSEDIAKIV